jgi:hypothetical protein
MWRGSHVERFTDALKSERAGSLSAMPSRSAGWTHSIVISTNAAKQRNSTGTSSKTEGRVYSAYGVLARNEAERCSPVDLRN